MKKTISLVIIALLLGLCVMGQVPQKTPLTSKEAPQPATSESPANRVPEMTAADVEAFLDGLVPQQIGHDDIAGATIAVVKDGKLLFAKGYGYADVKSKKPVSAQDTLFRPGSISKLFTWTAVMQLFEQGKLDLDRDVNEYLDFKIPDAFGKPITMKNIMTHTPGFEEQVKDLFSVNSHQSESRRVPENSYSGSHLSSRHCSGLFKLRNCSCRLHCSARIGETFRAIHC